MVIEKDIEVKSTLSGSIESSDEDGVDEEMSPKSVKPDKAKRVCLKILNFSINILLSP